MIRYALICQQAHEFESWFPSSEAFEEQDRMGFVTCPVCGSTHVEKQIMAPSIQKKVVDRKPLLPENSNLPKFVAQDSSEGQIRRFLHDLHEYVQKHSENVGSSFAEESRKIHYGESEQRSIHGEASHDEVRSLLEEGIDFFPLPSLPEKQN